MQYLTTSPEKWDKLKELARKNRKEMTYAEKIVWNFIRKNQLGVKFRRQQAKADYIVDFVCLDIKLVVEIDGPSHDEQKEYDEYRTNVLKDQGYEVIRFTNGEVTGSGNIVEKILRDEIERIIAKNPIPTFTKRKEEEKKDSVSKQI